MALLDGVGKAIGIASQGISDVAQTVNTAAQETRDNIARERQEKQQKNEIERQEKQERIAEEARKCPKCGQTLSGISAVCPLCGYEIKNAKTSSSIKELTKEINKLEQKRNTIADTISTKVSKRHSSPTDEKIASLISNFIVPNTKEDIFEFMILADGHMDAHFLAGKGRTTEVADIVINAWANKFTQTYQKAKISFGEDNDFKKIQELYDNKMQEIENARHFSLFRRK
jgi:predicted RNase H-like nuclease (RuvC/YqgF family)